MLVTNNRVPNSLTTRNASNWLVIRLNRLLMLHPGNSNSRVILSAWKKACIIFLGTKTASEVAKNNYRLYSHSVWSQIRGVGRSSQVIGLIILRHCFHSQSGSNQSGFFFFIFLCVCILHHRWYSVSVLKQQHEQKTYENKSRYESSFYTFTPFLWPDKDFGRQREEGLQKCVDESHYPLDLTVWSFLLR